jgi:uncharacterized membrane protein
MCMGRSAKTVQAMKYKIGLFIGLLLIAISDIYYDYMIRETLRSMITFAVYYTFGFYFTRLYDRLNEYSNSNRRRMS